MDTVERLWERLLFGAGPVGTSGGEGVDITFQHSWPWSPWVTLLALIFLALMIFWGYLRERADVTRRMRLTLATLRLLVVVVIFFMMYGWMINRHRTDLPDLIVAVDRSASMAVLDEYRSQRLRAWIRGRVKRSGQQSTRRWDQALALLLAPRDGWLDPLSERYRVKIYFLGQAAEQLVVADESDPLPDRLRSITPQEPASRLGAGLEQILAAQRGRPTAGVILLTDGVTTSGTPLSEVAEMARRRAVPLFVVGLGDDNAPRDVRLTDLLVDDVVFVDDVVNFDFVVQQEGYTDETVTVRLRDTQSDEVLAEEEVHLEQGATGQPLRLSYRPRAEGTQAMALTVDVLDGEANRENNRLERSIQVRNASVRVLFVQEYPSYEFRTLKHLLGRLTKADGGGKLVDLTTVLQEADFDYVDQDATATRVFPVSREDLFAYDVVLFGDVNPTYLSRSVMENIADFVTERGGGLVFLSGPRYTPLAFRRTPLEDLFPVQLETASVPDPARHLQDSFRVELTELGAESPFMQLGDSEESTSSIWRKLPELYWLLSAPDLRPAARVLAVHPTLADSTGQPLPVVTMQFVGAGKVIMIGTDETYRWSQYLGSDIFYARYWMQVLRYLSRSKLLSDRNPAELLTDRQQYLQGEPVRVQVRFLDERMAPTRDDGVRVVLDAANGRRREVSLDRDPVTRGEFSASLPDLPPGDYRLWLVSPSLEQAPSPQRFLIEPPASEQARLEMDAFDLEKAAQVSRGKFYRFEQAGRLMGDLPRGRQVRVETLPPEPVWNSSWLALLFVATVTTEWLLRKKAGMI
jgi:uncharacterized membrane protein